MKTLSKVFYGIGLFFSLFTLVYAIITLIGVISAFVQGSSEVEINGGAFSAAVALALAIYLLIISIVICSLAYHGFKYAGLPHHNGTHVVNLILGIFGGNLFYFLGGLFGILAA